MRLSYENKLLGILALSFGFVFFDRLALSFLFPFIAAELQLDNAQLGMLASALALTWSLSGVGLGALSDRLQARKPMLLLAVLAFSLFSAASGLVGGFVSLLLFRALMGVAEGPVLPIAQSMLAEASTPARRGFNMGIVNGSAPGLLGAVIGPPLLIGLATAYGWRTAFYLSCIPGLLIAWLIWRHVCERAPHVSSATLSVRHGLPARGMLQLLRHRNILLCVLIACSYITWFIILISFTPTFLVQVKGLTPARMGAVMSSLGLAWVVWGALVPAISDRIGRKPAMVVFSLIAACCPLVLLQVNDFSTLLLLVFLSYTGLGCFTLFMATIPAETVSPTVIATALGMIMGVGELVGGFVAPTAAGMAADRYGLPVVMWIAMAAALLPALLSLGLRETAPRRVASAATLCHGDTATR